MVQMDDLAEKIVALLQGNGLELKIYDAEGKETIDPAVGRNFFSMDPNLMVTLDEELGIKFSKGESTKDNLDLPELQKNIRDIANEFLLNFSIKEFNEFIKPRRFSANAKIKLAKRNTGMNESFGTNSLIKGKVENELNYAAGMTAEALSANIPGSNLNQIQSSLNELESEGKVEKLPSQFGEAPVYGLTKVKPVEESMIQIHESLSKMFGSSRVSQQTLENVRILVKHKIPVDENIRGSRSRHIGAIFLECNGERFRFPHNYLPGARAMAQHMAHGGTFGDKVGAYIAENTGNLLKLQSFNRYVTTNNLINEDSSGIVDTVKENIETIRVELRKLTGVKTYETVKARLETFEREQLSEDDTSQLKELFTIRRFDEKFEEVLPIVKQLVQEKDTYHKRIEEAAGNIILLRREAINTIPMFEFAGENARLGFKLNELALRIVENDELAGFVNKIGNKLCKEGLVNEFEKAVLKQILENVKVEEKKQISKEIKESVNLEAFFDKYTMNFF